MKLKRRRLLAGASASAVAIAATPDAGAARAAGTSTAIRPGDPRYDNLLRGDNFRFAGRPDEIRVAASADQPVVDHLHGVEVVTVGRDGVARRTVATREHNRDLWWAHTGGGGGTFGVVTRYWLRTPGETGTLLPRSPRRMLQHVVLWSWEQLTEASFTGLLRNFGTWHERNSAPGSAYAGIYGILQPPPAGLAAPLRGSRPGCKPVSRSSATPPPSCGWATSPC